MAGDPDALAYADHPLRSARSFEDSQERGPYGFWVHRHTFRAVGGGTLVEDEVRYRLPLGLAGSLAHALVVRRQLLGIFEFRAASIEKLLLADKVL